MSAKKIFVNLSNFKKIKKRFRNVSKTFAAIVVDQ